MRALFIVLASLVGALPAVADGEPGATRASLHEVRGITLSTHRSNSDWNSETLGATYGDLLDVGANWVAIHPYARISGDGAVTWRDLEVSNPPAWLRRPIEEAHARGLNILVKPHLAYWGSPFSWRGEIGFETPAQWRRFFRTYASFLLALVEAASDADAFAVGTELDKTLHRENEWRELITAVRARTEAPLTFASNWSDYHRVPFWDALDAVGIQAYFPLTERDDPDLEELRDAWTRRMGELRDFSERMDKNIVFTELGYNRSFLAAREPWSAHTDGVEATSLQLRCMTVALEAISAEPSVVGAFLWKWFPRPRSIGRDFALAEPEMQDVIRRVWKSDERSSGP